MATGPVHEGVWTDWRSVFVGRVSELEYVRTWMADAAARSELVTIDGPIGIGKSTLLTEMLRIARQRGARVARLTAPSPGTMLRRFRTTRSGRRQVIAIDDITPSSTQPLTTGVLANVPDRGVLMVVASRLPFTPAAIGDPLWHARARMITLGPLTSAEARQYLVQMGVALEDREITAIIRRSRGLPLALAAATDALARRPAVPATHARKDWIEELRSALTLIDFPVRLHTTMLASGLGRSGRELHLLLQDRLMADPPRAPMSSDDQHLLRAAFRDRSGRPEDVAARLYLSRATYYRRLRAALERLAATLPLDT